MKKIDSIFSTVIPLPIIDLKKQLFSPEILFLMEGLQKYIFASKKNITTIFHEKVGTMRNWPRYPCYTF